MEKTKRKNNMNMSKLKEQKAITLIALVVTIIILIILAGISIGSLSGEKGIIDNAKFAKNETNKSKLEEQIYLSILEAEQENENASLQNVKDKLKENGVISEDSQVDEKGKITTNEGYEFEGKLNDYLGVKENNNENQNSEVQKENAGLSLEEVNKLIEQAKQEIKEELREEIKSETKLEIYPVGSIYISTNGTNPSQIIGGKWESYGQGRTLVGIDSTQTEFNAINKIGGEKVHTLTIDEMPSHNHDYILDTIKDIVNGFGQFVYDGGQVPPGGTPGYGVLEAYKIRYGQRMGTFSIRAKGGSKSHNNLQPYIVTYMWKRTE